MEKEKIIKYYDEVAITKLKAFVNANPRVESAMQSILDSVSNPSKILEIGCGIGDISYRLSNHYAQSTTVGFDISPRSIEIAKKLFESPRLKFLAGDIDVIEEHNFDLVVLMDVFEHISQKERDGFTEKLKTLITNDAFIFASCPTPEFLAWLRENSPKHIQPVDEDIDLNVIHKFAATLNKRIWFYKPVSIWFHNDYFHFMLGPKHRISKLKPKTDKVPSGSILSRLFTTQEGKAEKEVLNKRLSLIFEKLGDEIYREIIRK